MRSRTIREGSVGLFILLGLALFVTVILWLRGIRFGDDSYTIRIEFADSNGMIVGGSVRYRGVKIGTIAELIPTTNGIEAVVSISPADLLMPKNVQIEANQSGLISETTIDITPLTQVKDPDNLPSPLSARCDSDLVICGGDRLQGVTGISFNAAVRSTMRLSESFTDPEFFGNITSLTANASQAAARIGSLSTELTQLSRSVRSQIQAISGTANTVTAITATTARQINSTAAAYQSTAVELNALTSNLNGLIIENRTNIAGTLNSISSTSTELTTLIQNFNTTLETADTRDLLNNLEVLTANAAEASNALKTTADALNDPNTILNLQRTLNAARATFENVQKITADLDELTGNPAFRQDLQELIQGLSGLVSSTQDLENQIYLAQQLATEEQALGQSVQNNSDRHPPEDEALLAPRSPEERRRAAIELFSAPAPPPTPANRNTDE
ncbi:MlaD family protein [Spirulina major CS-329]|uniref:MlaD family protein n=1 Tax=Spirulina TaxID=1154 RepID=UPI0023310066|nr:MULTISPECIES: MlaD family protein [Spirulina]MDB9493332.1 MlaD family protein [Spirulina subsalsa CS-330]MDB9502501.1 MlaD family protein [Spirulina major CS-329]